MAALERLDPFWLGAGGFLTLFGANELITYASAPVPRWLGGPLIVVGETLAVLVGLAVMYGLGIREPPPRESAPAQGVADDPAADEDAREDQTEDRASAAPARAKKKRRKSAPRALPPSRGSGTSSAWPRSSTN